MPSQTRLINKRVIALFSGPKIHKAFYIISGGTVKSVIYFW